MKRVLKSYLISNLLLVLGALAALAQASIGDTSSERIKLVIAQVRTGKTVEARTNDAEHLAALAQNLGSRKATESLVSDISSLLDSPDDSVRYWVATALGNIGPPARSTVPKLLEILPKADCLNGAITSASGIRHALFKMGFKQPPRSTGCHPIAG